MNDLTALSPYGALIEPATLRIQRELAAPVERVWAYLTDSDLRRQWLAAGPMELVPGGAVELTWRNDNLSAERDERPPGMSAEHSMQSQVIRVEPPTLLCFGWGGGDVTFELEASGAGTRLTVTHRRLSERGMVLSVSAGWHAHLDVLADCVVGRSAGPFWSKWTRLRGEYEKRLSD